MKRSVSIRVIALLPVLCVVAWVAFALKAQDVPTEALRQEYEERFRRLSTKIEEVLGLQAALQRRINDLSAEMTNLREEQSQLTVQSVKPDDLRKLADKVREIDRKREEDRRLILDELRKLAQAPIPEPAPRKEPSKTKEPENASPVSSEPQKGYEYVVKEGDTLSTIVAAYQQTGVKVTLDAVLKANPNAKPKALKVGQKVFIPDPALGNP